MNQIHLYKEIMDLNNKFDSIAGLCNSGFVYDSLHEERILELQNLLFGLLSKNNNFLIKFDSSVLKKFSLLHKQNNKAFRLNADKKTQGFSNEVCKVIISLKTFIESITARYSSNQNLKNLILKNVDGLYILCSKHFMKSLFVYGSILNESFNRESDIDFLYETDTKKFETLHDSKHDYIDNFLEFEENLSVLLKRKVDLIPNIPIQNKYLKESIDQSKQLLYAA